MLTRSKSSAEKENLNGPNPNEMPDIPDWLQELLTSQEKSRIDREKQHQEEMNTLRSLLVNVNQSHQDPLVPAENDSSQTTPKEHRRAKAFNSSIHYKLPAENDRLRI